MSKFYTKNKKGEFLPIELNSIFNEDLKDRLVIIRIGSDDKPVSKNDLYETVRSFEEANVINKIKNTSVIITPYHIEVGLESKEQINEKFIYLQINGGDISLLEEEIQEIYRRIKHKHKNVVVLPTPLKIKDYEYTKDILKRCQVRKERRGRNKQK